MSNPDLDKLLADEAAKVAAMTPDQRRAYYRMIKAEQIAYIKANPYTGGERQARAMMPKMANENDLIWRGEDWIAWLDDLPLPIEYHDGVERLQAFIGEAIALPAAPTLADALELPEIKALVEALKRDEAFYQMGLLYAPKGEYEKVATLRQSALAALQTEGGA
jgi:hypothetical protein